MFTLTIRSSVPTLTITSEVIITKLYDDYIPIEVEIKPKGNEIGDYIFLCSASIVDYIAVGTVLMVQRVKLHVTKHFTSLPL